MTVPSALAWKPPGAYNPPVIHGPTYTRDYSEYPSSITVECTVTWDPAAFQRYVWVYVDSTRYTMSYVYEGGSWKYKKTVNVNPWQSHNLYVKAREIIQYEYISLETTSSIHNEPSLTHDSYSASGDKYAIILEFTPLEDKTDSSGQVRKGYWAHYNSWTSMKSEVAGSNFDYVYEFNIEWAETAGEAGTAFISHLNHFKDNTDSDDYVFVYIVSHGITTGLGWAGSLAVSWASMNSALDNYDNERMTVVIEACRSGAGISTLIDTNRLIITACGSDTDAYHIVTPDETQTKSLFTYNFLLYLSPTKSFAYAYYYASVACDGTQSPQLSVSMTTTLARMKLNC